MNIHIATDHAGLDMKESVKKYLLENGHHVTDHGAFSYDPDDDYPDFVISCAQTVADDIEHEKKSFGIIFGGSGQGEQIAANKVSGIRAIEYYGGNLEIVKLGREHNDANILSIGARFVSTGEAIAAIELFISTEFSGEQRHVRRLEKIEKTENNDFDIWNKHKKFIQETRQEGYFNERDIIWCSIGKNIGFEQDGRGTDFRRPVLVIKKFNKHVFFGIPVSTKIKPDNKYYFNIDLYDGVSRNVILSQAKLFDAKRLTQKIGVLEKLQFFNTKKALARVLGISASDYSEDKAEAIT